MKTEKCALHVEIDFSEMLRKGDGRRATLQKRSENRFYNYCNDAG